MKKVGLLIAIVLFLGLPGFTVAGRPRPVNFCTVCIASAARHADQVWASCLELGTDPDACAAEAGGVYACDVVNNCNICDPSMRCDQH